MLRWAILVIFAVAATGAGSWRRYMAAARPHQGRRAKLPPGLPRAHYDYRTTLTYRRRRRSVDHATPTCCSRRRVPTFRPLIRRLLPGSSTLPGYYGSTHSYDYQGPYYGGPYVDYRDRLPYACGVYGYC